MLQSKQQKKNILVLLNTLALIDCRRKFSLYSVVYLTRIVNVYQ